MTGKGVNNKGKRWLVVGCKRKQREYAKLMDRWTSTKRG